MVDLRSIALALPGVDEGTACAGTAVESHTYGVSKKTFLFVSKKFARLKLSASSSEAKRMGCDVGANGWVKLSLDDLPPASVVRRWITESHGLAAGAKAPAKAKRASAILRRASRSTAARPAEKRRSTSG